MTVPSRTMYVFGAFVLDPEDKVLDRDGVLVPLTPEAFRHARVACATGLAPAWWPTPASDAVKKLSHWWTGVDSFGRESSADSLRLRNSLPLAL